MTEMLANQTALGMRDPTIILLILVSAALYVGSMILMKIWDSYPPGLMAIGIVLCLLGATWLEILALRQAKLAMVYVAILGAEAIMLAAVARFGFGETLMPREIVGGTLIVIGTMITASQGV